jgi:hypothetical protein
MFQLFPALLKYLGISPISSYPKGISDSISVFTVHIREVRDPSQGRRLRVSPTISPGSSSSRLRFSKRSPARNVSTSEIEVWTQGDSNSFEGGFEAEERHSFGAPRDDAPTEIRTPVLGLKGLRPSPLDDGGVYNGENSIILPLWGQECRLSLKRNKLVC